LAPPSRDRLEVDRCALRDRATGQGEIDNPRRGVAQRFSEGGWRVSRMLDNDDEREGAEGGKEEWEILGLEKRIDYENLQRVFERLDLNVRTLKTHLAMPSFFQKSQSMCLPPFPFLHKGHSIESQAEFSSCHLRLNL
jgi:hypothetical protein